MAENKFPEEERSFETRLKFIRDIFADTFTPNQIMANCIQYKLDQSFQEYIKEIHKSLWLLHDKDPLKVLRRVDKPGR